MKIKSTTPRCLPLFQQAINKKYEKGIFKKKHGTVTVIVLEISYSIDDSV